MVVSHCFKLDSCERSIFIGKYVLVSDDYTRHVENISAPLMNRARITQILSPPLNFLYIKNIIWLINSQKTSIIRKFNREMFLRIF
jgi:hypothetical protein